MDVHGNLGRVASEGTDVFLDPSESLTFCEKRMVCENLLAVEKSMDSRSCKPRLPTPASLISLPGMNPMANKKVHEKQIDITLWGGMYR